MDSTQMNTQQRINKDLILREQLAVQRTIMANQTTFLSFLKTSMYFLVAGLSIRNLLKIDNGLAIEILLFAVSFFMFIFGTVNYFVQHKKIKASKVHIGNYQMEYLDSIDE